MIYKLQLSTKESISINEKELEKFRQNVGANFIELENGIINPSFVVSITADWEATRAETKSLRASSESYLPEPINDERGSQTMKEELERYRPEFMNK